MTIYLRIFFLTLSPAFLNICVEKIFLRSSRVNIGGVIELFLNNFSTYILIFDGRALRNYTSIYYIDADLCKSCCIYECEIRELRSFL